MLPVNLDAKYIRFVWTINRFFKPAGLCLQQPGTAGYSMEMNNVAMPRKLKNPAMSVIVVRKIDDDWAGSWPDTVSIIGITAPETPAMIIDSIMEKKITIVRPMDWLQK